MNKRILIAAAAAIGSTLALPASPVAAQDVSSCESQNLDDCLPCEWDDSILAGSPDCFAPCEYDPSIPADSSACDPCLYPDSSTIDPSCEDETTTTAPQETTTTSTMPEQTTTTTQPETTTTLSDTTTSTTVAAESGSPTTTAVQGDSDAVRSAPAAAAASPTAELPETGGNTSTAVIAFGLLAVGAALVAASRRPQTS